MRKKHKKPLFRKKPKGERLNHAQKRFRQRYGRPISGEQLSAMVELAEANKVQSVVTDKHGHKKVVLRVGPEVFRFVYSPETRQILTFLPIG